MATTNHALAVRPAQRLEVVRFSDADITLIKDTYAKGCTNQELQLFLDICRTLQLTPFLGQIHAIQRYDSQLKRMAMKIQVAIDGYRVLAERSGNYAGQSAPQWCGEDQRWLDLWLSDEYPVAARIGIRRKDWAEPTYGVALWKEYKQTYKPRDSQETVLMPMWQKMPAHMLAKCAERLGLAKAFPTLLEEMLAGHRARADVTLESFDPQPHIVETTSREVDVPEDLPASQALADWAFAFGRARTEVELNTLYGDAQRAGLADAAHGFYLAAREALLERKKRRDAAKRETAGTAEREAGAQRVGQVTRVVDIESGEIHESDVTEEAPADLDPDLSLYRTLADRIEAATTRRELSDAWAAVEAENMDADGDLGALLREANERVGLNGGGR